MNGKYTALFRAMDAVEQTSLHLDGFSALCSEGDIPREQRDSVSLLHFFLMDRQRAALEAMNAAFHNLPDRT
ncbi:MAG: hypothetical protein JSR26_04115 [Proteobacteria bacterium]|nr:hypothetical protein [Pseudomonadota bacterium]